MKIKFVERRMKKTPDSNVVYFPGNLSETRIMNSYDSRVFEDVGIQAAVVAAQAIEVKKQIEKLVEMLGATHEY
jgi:hypothetical protein